MPIPVEEWASLLMGFVRQLQGGVALLESGSAAHVAGLVTQLKPLHALGAGAVGEALGLCIAL